MLAASSTFEDAKLPLAEELFSKGEGNALSSDGGLYPGASGRKCRNKVCEFVENTDE